MFNIIVKRCEFQPHASVEKDGMIPIFTPASSLTQGSGGEDLDFFYQPKPVTYDL